MYLKMSHTVACHICEAKELMCIFVKHSLKSYGLWKTKKYEFSSHPMKK